MTSRWRSNLVFRLYLVGVVQLLLVIVAAAVIGILIVRFSTRRHPLAVISQIETLIEQDPAGLERAFAEQRALDNELSLYGPDGVLILSNVQPPLPAPRWRDIPADVVAQAGPQFERGAPPIAPRDLWLHAVPFIAPGPPPLLYADMSVHGRAGVLVARLPFPEPGAAPALFVLTAGLLVIFVGAYLTARWIARPLEQVSRAARALGRGDLRARTDLRRADELGEVGRAFNEMAGRIQALVLAEKELLANVAHELRTPLARIRVALEIAAEGDASSAQPVLGEIALDLSELEALIDDVLTATRFELNDGVAPSAGLPLHIEAIGAHSLAERAAKRFRARHPQRALVLDLAGPDSVIEVDPILFRRAIDNILENADKYSPDGAQSVLLGVEAQPGSVTLRIADRGIGITEDDLLQVFAPFFRSERSRSRNTGGVGLGLTLTKRIVEAHSGTVEVLSAGAGSGTTVSITVPRAER